MVSFDKLKLANDSAWVTCEGETLPVYGVETVASNKVTGWIPSQAGKVNYFSRAISACLCSRLELSRLLCTTTPL